ncbi:MAG TPA: hypothetical protein VFY23_11575 [Candidatus Limnocylindrales bacterium]|nr:hypothetical protein [Candidatus Limnocylindrales bacterium]
MTPLLLVMILGAALIALIPVWRLRVAGWPRRWLVIAWVVYAVAIFVAVRAPGPSRFLLPILVLAYVAPFIAGPERLARVLRGPGEAPRPIIDVTPRPPTSLPRGRDERDDEDRG